MYVTVFPDFNHEHIDKDVGQITYILSKGLDLDANILSYNKMFDNGVDCELGKINHILIPNFFKRVSHRFLDFNVLFFLLKKSSTINVLNLYHSTFATHVYVILYKIMNPRGKTYIKLDLDVVNERRVILNQHYGLKNRIKKSVFMYFRKLVDVVSVESEEAYELLLDRRDYTIDKLFKIPNGISSDILDENYGQVEYKNKKNILLTVARIGSKDKCNELMLDAIELCDLKDWKFLFVGPIEDGFKNKIEEFYIKNPSLRERVLFLGSKNRTELIEIYKSAKVFALSSIKEGFPLVYAEASFYGCHIITTAVSGSADITDNGNLGDIIPIGNHASFYKAIQNVVDNDVSCVHFEEIRKYAIDNFTWEHILPCLTKKLANG